MSLSQPFLGILLFVRVLRMPDLAAALEKLTSVASPALSYNTDLVRQAWETFTSSRKRTEGSHDERVAADPIAYSWIDQLWTDHIIVRVREMDRIGNYLRVPYTVNPPGSGVSDVVFGAPERVREVFVAASARTRVAALDRVVALSALSSEM